MNDVIERILNRQLNKGYLSEKDKSVYRYGYTLAISVVVNTLLAASIGIIFRELRFIVLFHLFFIPLRIYCGGWHASTIVRCTLFSTMFMMANTIIYKYLLSGCSVVPLLICDLAFITLIALSRPNADKWKRVNEQDITRFIWIVRLQLALHVAIILASLAFHSPDVLKILAVVHGSEVLLLLLDRVAELVNQNKGRKERA